MNSPTVAQIMVHRFAVMHRAEAYSAAKVYYHSSLTMVATARTAAHLNSALATLHIDHGDLIAFASKHP